MKKLLIGLLVLGSISAFATPRVKNPCWNTRLSEEGKQICSVCSPAVDAIVKDSKLSPCKEEQIAVEECLADLENCSNYQDVLTINDNCSTNLVKACFNNL